MDWLDDCDLPCERGAAAAGATGTHPGEGSPARGEHGREHGV